MFDRRKARARGISDVLDHVTARGVTLPSEIVEARDQLDRLEAMKPAPALGEDIVAAWLDLNPKAAEAAAVRHVSVVALTDAHELAVTKLRHRLADVVDAHADALVEQFRPAAEDLIDKVTQAATLDGDVAALVRAGRDDDAEIAAHYEQWASQLAALYKLRDRITTADWGAGVGYDVRTWKDPRAVVGALSGAAAGAETFRRGVRAGGELWWPTPSQAEAAARGIHDMERRARMDQEEAANRERIKRNASPSFR